MRLAALLVLSVVAASAQQVDWLTQIKNKIIGKSQVTSQSSNQSVTLATTPGAAVYIIKYSGYKHGTCTAGVTLTFSWTDAGQAETLTTGPLFFSPTFASGEIPITISGGNVSFTSSGATNCTYDLNVWLTRDF